MAKHAETVVKHAEVVTKKVSEHATVVSNHVSKHASNAANTIGDAGVAVASSVLGDHVQKVTDTMKIASTKVQRMDAEAILELANGY